MPKASIIMPAYNMAKFIRETIDSILNQDYTDFECIIIDDGSTDATSQIVHSYNDKRIKYIRQECSGGPSKPRNIGLQHAKGEYLFLFDADDVMSYGKIKKSIEALDACKEADLLFTNFSSIDASGNILKPDYLFSYESLRRALSAAPNIGESFFISAKKIYAALIYENFIGTSSVVLRKSALSSSDIFNEELKNSDDRLFWLTFTKSHNVIYLNEKLHLYRVQPDSISGQGFVRRGESKIKGLKLVYGQCEDEGLRCVVRRQIASDYASLAYAYKKNKMYAEQTYNAKQSLHYALSFKALKMFLLGFIVGLLQKQ